MKLFLKVTVLFLLVTVIYSCKKYETDFQDFFNGREKVYPGTVTDVIAQPGNGRTGLKWKASSDPSISKYVIYWNNKADSLVFPVAEGNTADTIRATITGLREYTYSFTIYSFDKKGNRSIPKEINNVKVYGPIYQATLLNRAYNAVTPFTYDDQGNVTLNFITPDTVNIANTYNTNTVIRYVNKSGMPVELNLSSKVNSILLPDFKDGSNVTYKSYYIPSLQAIDEFAVSEYSTYPTITRSAVQCDKSLFSALHLFNDIGQLESGTGLEKLWDGSVGPQGYPNLFHSSDSNYPPVISFDMGKVYNNLLKVEETGRNCCGNPLEFEIWGIADLTNANTTLTSDNSGWKAEMQSKGWTLLTEAVRTDDGQNAKTFDFISNPPPVRYIRMRVTKKLGTTSFNMSELTFWNFQ